MESKTKECPTCSGWGEVFGHSGEGFKLCPTCNGSGELKLITEEKPIEK